MPRIAQGIRKNKSHKIQTDKVPTEFKAGFLKELDGRCDLTRTLKANYDAIVNDLGGAGEVAHVKAALIERFVWLEAVVQTIEQEMATGAVDKGHALNRWIQAINALASLAKLLGIDRRSTGRPWVEASVSKGQGK